MKIVAHESGKYASVERGKEADATDRGRVRGRVRVTFRVSLLFILLRLELYACCYLYLFMFGLLFQPSVWLCF